MADCKPRVLRRDCKETTSGGTDEKQCPSFSFCAGNKTVSFDGECMTVTDRTYQIPDGTYSTVTFKDGCIVGVGHGAVPMYTPNDCCGPAGSGNEGAGDVTISAHPANLLKDTPDGLVVTPVFKGSGVSVTGAGTLTDPFIITASASGEGGVFVTSGSPMALSVEGKGTDYTDPIEISLKTVMQSGRYGPFSINEYGQITEFDKDNDYIKTITADPPLQVEVKDGEAKLSLDIEYLRVLLGSSSDGDTTPSTGAAPTGYYVSRVVRKPSMFSDSTVADYVVSGPVGGWVSYDGGVMNPTIVKQIGESGTLTFTKSLTSSASSGFNTEDTIVIKASDNEQMDGAVLIYTVKETLTPSTDNSSA